MTALTAATSVLVAAVAVLAYSAADRLLDGLIVGPIFGAIVFGLFALLRD